MNRKHNKVVYVTPELAGEQSINFLNCCKMPPPSLLSLFPGFSCFPLSHNQQIRGKHTKINKAIELRSKEKELLSSSDRSVSVGAQIVALIQLLRGPVSVLCWTRPLGRVGSWKRKRKSSSKIVRKKIQIKFLLRRQWRMQWRIDAAKIYGRPKMKMV